MADIANLVSPGSPVSGIKKSRMLNVPIWKVCTLCDCCRPHRKAVNREGGVARFCMDCSENLKAARRRVEGPVRVKEPIRVEEPTTFLHTPARGPGKVYFIYSQDLHKIKIGFSATRPRQRFKNKSSG